MLRKAIIIKSEKHRRFVASLPCFICKKTNVQCCHIRSIPNYGNVGLSVRNDVFSVPMCIEHHFEQHQIGEKKFYLKYKKNPIYISELICKKSPCKKIKSLPYDYFEKYRNYNKTFATSYV